MGGAGSGNWYRFDKKATTDECHSVDVLYLHRNGLLKAGGWFSLRWSRGKHETGSIGGSVDGALRLVPERQVLARWQQTTCVAVDGCDERPCPQ
jgi:hypothetical protein